MSHFPSDLPEPVRAVLALSDDVDGETIVFRADDRIAYASDAAVARYPFCDFATGPSFEDLFWLTLRQGLATEQLMRLDPAAYLAAAQAARICRDTMDFTKTYAGAVLLCHHRRLPDGWSVQVRVNLAQLQSAGLAGEPPPTVLDAVARTREARRLSTALDQLPVGVASVDITGRVLWQNAAARAILLRDRGLTIADGRLTPAEAVRTAFADALVRVAAGHGPQYLPVPDGEGRRLLSVSSAPAPGELLVLIAPDDPSAADVDAVLATLGLSPAERAVATAIGANDGPQAIAQATGKAVATVRRQLATIYEKLEENMGVTSQRALARLIGQVASIAGAARRTPH